MKKAAVMGSVAALALVGAGFLAAPASAAETEETGIADVGQAVGLPASGTCADVDDADLNWSGVASGGWTAGWGTWLNDGAGGEACLRTLVYDENSDTWSVAAA